MLIVFSFSLCQLGIFAWFFCHLLIFSKSTFSENFIRNIIIRQSVKQAIHFVGPDLGPNCLQRLLADDTSRQRVIYTQKNN